MADPLAPAVAAIARGELVVYPTDTLLGLAARATDPAAVDRLLAAKDRPSVLPISLAVSSLEEVEPWVVFSESSRAAARRLLPGPVTLLLPPSERARDRLAPSLLGPDGALGVRVPDHPVARELARRAGPLTATSANRHGAPAARTIAEARRAFGRAVTVYLPAEPVPSGRPSTLIDLRAAEPRVVSRS
jgi:L-threonylcarbamoyladenylate synthase